MYRFFYDESEHSRKINQRTIYASNYGSHFVAGIIGYKSDHERGIFDAYTRFEEKYKEIFSVQELKSSIVKIKQMQYGFSSLKPISRSLLIDYMDFFINHKIHCYIAVLHKIEYIVLQLFPEYKNSFTYDMDILRYTITKLIDVYRPQEVIDAIYKNDGTFINTLSQFIKSHIETYQNVAHKDKEIHIFRQIIQVLDQYNQKVIFDWNYMIAFHGFKAYLDENVITEYELLIDQEGVNHTAISADYIGLKAVQEVNSKESIGIRISDLFTGLISKFIRAMSEDLKYGSKEEIEKLKYLSQEWFSLDSQSFEMYQKYSTIILHQNPSWYKSYSGNYADTFLSLIAFLNYVTEYKTFEMYQKVSLSEHQYRFNQLIVDVVLKHHRKIHMKIPFEKIKDTEEDFFISKKGVKIYKDYSKHDLLLIPEYTDDNNGIYIVISVGTNAEMNLPVITIKEHDQMTFYRLPDAYLEWAILCVGYAMSGISLFPANVRFAKIQGQYSVKFLDEPDE